MLPKPAILVVDDDESIGTMLRMMLEHEGYAVIVNQDALNLQQLLATVNVGLVILDLLINGVKGTDVCVELKVNEATSNIPILMMTALPGVEQQCYEAGADDFIAKPFEMDVLLAKIAAFMQ
jgi:DNA-binding response OmpR family regulator